MHKIIEEYIVKNLRMRREREILDRLYAAGYEGYFVGGCIRDILIAARHGQAADGTLPIGDIDVATNASPQQVQEVFASYPVILTGVKHGTVTVVLLVEGAPPSPRAGSQPADMSWGNPGPAQVEGLEAALPQRTEVKVAQSEQSGLDFPNAEAKPVPSNQVGMDGKRQDAQPRPIPVEVTTYRSDGSYSDHRRPDSVKFLASIAEDLARRDFTINAMACDTSGNVVDCFGGQDDIDAKIIRAVGDPNKRFQEDALRIMRALRFAAVLGFTIEPETETAIFENKYLLQDVSAERIFTELKKLLTGKYAGSVVRRYVDVLGVVIPELLPMKGFEQHNAYHRYDVLEHCIRAMELVRTTPENADYMKLAALFHDMGKPGTYSMDDNGVGHFYGHPKRSEALVRAVLLRLKADKRTLERVAGLVKRHDLLFERDARLLKKWMNRLGPEVLLEILEIKLADNLATGNMSAELEAKFADIRQMIAEILAQEQCFSREDLAVSGNDVLEAGITPGPAVGAALDQLLEAVIEGACENERGALLRYLQTL